MALALRLRPFFYFLPGNYRRDGGGFILFVWIGRARPMDPTIG